MARGFGRVFGLVPVTPGAWHGPLAPGVWKRTPLRSLNRVECGAWKSSPRSSGAPAARPRVHQIKNPRLWGARATKPLKLSLNHPTPHSRERQEAAHASRERFTPVLVPVVGR